MPWSIRRCCVCTSCAADACISASAASWVRAPSRSANRVANSAATSFERTRPAGRAFRDRPGEQAFGGGHRQQRGGHARAGAFAEDGDIAWVTAEFGDVVLHPRNASTRSRRYRLLSKLMLRRRQRRQVQTPQRAQPIVDRYVHAAAPGQRGAVVQRGCRAAQDVAAAVDEHHDRQRFPAGDFGCDHVESEAVLAHRLVPADAEHGVATLLRRTVGEAVAVPHARPGLGGLRRPESQRAQRAAEHTGWIASGSRRRG